MFIPYIDSHNPNKKFDVDSHTFLIFQLRFPCSEVAAVGRMFKLYILLKGFFSHLAGNHCVKHFFILDVHWKIWWLLFRCVYFSLHCSSLYISLVRVGMEQHFILLINGRKWFHFLRQFTLNWAHFCVWLFLLRYFEHLSLMVWEYYLPLVIFYHNTFH